MDNKSHKTTTVSYAAIAIVAVVALLGVVVLTVTVAILLQQAQGAKPSISPCVFTPGANASKLRCVQ
jgi:hypothetical protein